MRFSLATLGCLVALVSPVRAVCVGDCGDDGEVTVEEIVRAVSVALGNGDSALCPAGDANGDGAITVEEIVRAIGHALDGCPESTPTPTPSPTPPATATAEAGRIPVFTEVTVAVGLDYEHDYVDTTGTNPEVTMFMGGFAAGDYDGDGWIDLFAVRGDHPNLLLRNLGGRFVAVDAPEVAMSGTRSSGPTLADVDGDGRLDLYVGAVEGGAPRIFHNRGDGGFEDRTGGSGLEVLAAFENMGAAFGDFDGDGDLDLFTSHWGTQLKAATGIPYLWRNDGDFRFSDVTTTIGIPGMLPAGFFDHTFTPNFVDIDTDGHMDILLTIDFGNSRVVRNRGDGTYDLQQPASLTDENGMGAAIGDYDNDGDLDWFVTSIHDPDGIAEQNWGVTGNRLYRNDGDGNFEDVSEVAGVREGYWGWGACFADVNNDGWLDIFHVNGTGRLDLGARELLLQTAADFHDDPARLFLANGDGTFREVAGIAGTADRRQGRGVGCFDYDRDGDIDLFIANNGGPPVVLRNETPQHNHWLAVKLRSPSPNSEAIGARVIVEAGGLTQMREIRAGSNYVSQDPAIAHFGLGTADVAERLEVVWPQRRGTTILTDVAVDRYLEIAESPDR